MLGEGIIKGMAETARNFLGSYVSAERLTLVIGAVVLPTVVAIGVCSRGRMIEIAPCIALFLKRCRFFSFVVK
jgi:hypothetical protein